MDERMHLNKARDLLQSGKDESLPYAALELRFAIEALAYAKLRLYAPRLPALVLERWQPPQALKALLEFEPLATENHVIRICEETSLGVPSGNWIQLGEHRSLKLIWARQTYNKLGSYLHMPSPKSERRLMAKGEMHTRTIREDLLKIAAELEPIVLSSIDSSLALITQFECKRCGELVIRNTQSLRETHRAICLNPNCQSEYHCTETETAGEFTVELVASNFACVKCGHENEIQNRFLRIGYEFPCAACKTLHRFVQCDWGYHSVADSDEVSA